VILLEDEFTRGLEELDDFDEEDEKVDEEEENVVEFRRPASPPSWEAEAIAEAQKIITSRDWVPLLRREDLDERRPCSMRCRAAEPSAASAT
jgi:hypothetical protein